MITKLSIRNFKSIKEMDIDCARVNLFIGEPNTGKSNILEALGLLSWSASDETHDEKKLRDLGDFIRFESIHNLFYGNNRDEPFEIQVKGNIEKGIEVKFNDKEDIFEFYPKLPLRDGSTQVNITPTLFSVSSGFQSELDDNKLSSALRRIFRSNMNPLSRLAIVRTDKDGSRWFIEDGINEYIVTKSENGLDVCLVINMLCKLDNTGLYKKINFPMGIRYKIPSSGLGYIRFYRFKEQNEFKSKSSLWLNPPNGSNLLAVVMGRKELYEIMNEFFTNFNLRLIPRPHDSTFDFFRDSEGLPVNLPYILASDTLKRMIFYNVAIDSNENSTLVFEEPEVHAFPAYIDQLGEKIAFDKTNQYFIATHNPYLFLSIVGKTPKNDVNVFATYMKDYQTKVKQATSEEISDLMNYDPFFNLGQIIEEDDNDSD